MPLYQLAPEAVQDMYLSCVREHNRPEVEQDVRRDENIRATAILDVVRLVWGSVAAGELIMQADRMVMADGDERPMCGGMILELEKA